MTDKIVALNELAPAGDDSVVPFQVEGLDVRGRAIQVGPLLNAILDRHDYPPVVARLLAEAVALAALLGTSLKFEGKFTIQTKGNGPVDLLVADFSTPDSLRAYARFDEEALAAAIAHGETSPAQLLGEGVLAFTIDQGRHMHPYQGIVPLDGSSLEDIAGVYFRQSEQIPTRVRLAVAELIDRDADGNPRHGWRAGGLIAQFLPDAPDRMRHKDLPGGDGDDGHDIADDDAWSEARALVETIHTDELTDPHVGVERLLYRLFHERGVRIYPPQKVLDRCTCSRDKIKGILEGFSAEEIESSQEEDGSIAVSCEFCSTTYRYQPAEFRQAEVG